MKKVKILDNEKKVVILDYEDCDLVVLEKSTGKKFWFLNPSLDDIDKILYED